jgi:hypothetical protein
MLRISPKINFLKKPEGYESGMPPTPPLYINPRRSRHRGTATMYYTPPNTAQSKHK